MRHELWRAVLAACSDLDRMVAGAVGDYPSQAPPRPAMARRPPRVPGGPQLVRAATVPAAAPTVDVEHGVLQRLHDDVRARIESLRVQVVAEPGGEQAMLALVFFFDERIMGRLPEFLATSWPLLQTRLTGRNTGGVDFFRLIERLLESESPPLVFEVYYFCLAHGFRGHFATDPAALEAYRAKLRARIAAPEPARVAVAREPAGATPRPIRSRALYYVTAVAVVVLFAWALTVWSNQ
ncbi:MAG TPA: DotU family type IV/VI secretion system protein [Kofleriaceae bacterium]|nr:DotU family type IV/VI secretion system protein [Kofleriaceae bacterium]